MRTSKRTLNKILKKQIVSMLEQTVIDITTEKDAESFLNDFFTDSEKEMFAKRLAIAYWLKKGRSYENIKNNLQVSSATIASVQQIMDTQGMKKTLKNIEAEEWANKWVDKFNKLRGK